MGIVTLIGMMNAAIVMRNAETVYANAHMDIMQNMESAVSIMILFIMNALYVVLPLSLHTLKL